MTELIQSPASGIALGDGRDVIDTVPPEAIVELKFSEPLPTPASPSMMTVEARRWPPS